MNLQYLQDKDGNTTSVLVPIEEWNLLIGKIDDFETDTPTKPEISDAHKRILDERLEDYRKNPTNNMDFQDTLVQIRMQYNL